MSSEKFLEYIKGYILECRLCEGQLREPKSLPCRHVFCRDCIAKRIEDNSKQSFYICPTCTANHAFPAEGIGSLPEASLQKSLLEIVCIFEKKTIPCSACDSGNHAIIACVKCGHVYCKSCEVIHKKFSSTREHDTVLIEELDNVKKFSEFQKNRYSRCAQHESESSKLFCVEDEKEMCKLCTYEPSHKNHDVIPIIVKLQELKDQITDMNSDIDTRIAEFHKQKELIQDALVTARNEETQALEIIQHRINDVCELVRKYEKKVSDKIKSRCSARQDYLTKQLDVVNEGSRENKLCRDKSGLMDVLPVQCALDMAKGIIDDSEHLPDVEHTDDEICNVPSNDFIASTLDSYNVFASLKTTIGVNSDSVRRFEPCKVIRTSLGGSVSTLATEVVQEALWEYRNVQRCNSMDKIAEKCVKRMTEACKGKWNCVVAPTALVGYCTHPMKEILLSIAGFHLHLFQI